MNLIEQLGWYSKAKIKRDDINHTLENCEFLGGGDAREGLCERLESIENALLEYRRRYKIYQVGDKVVRIDGQDVVFEVAGGCIGGDTCNPDRNGIVYTDYIVMTKGLPHHRSKLRHATDAEAKVGKRSDE